VRQIADEGLVKAGFRRKRIKPHEITTLERRSVIGETKGKDKPKKKREREGEKRKDVILPVRRIRRKMTMAGQQKEPSEREGGKGRGGPLRDLAWDFIGGGHFSHLSRMPYRRQNCSGKKTF